MLENAKITNHIIILKHDDDDFEIYFPEIPPYDSDFLKLLEKYGNSGTSIRGRREDSEWEFSQITLE